MQRPADSAAAIRIEMTPGSTLRAAPKPRSRGGYHDHDGTAFAGCTRSHAN